MCNHVCVCMCVFERKLYPSLLYVDVVVLRWLRLCLYIWLIFWVCSSCCVCLWLCTSVCLSLRLWMRTGVYASTMASLFPSVCVGGWDFCQHDLFARSGVNLSCWTSRLQWKTQTTQCFLSWQLQHTSDYTIMFFFSFLSSLLHHWCGSASQAPGQIQFHDHHGSLSLSLTDSIKSSK